jgi:hypothetical protein
MPAIVFLVGTDGTSPNAFYAKAKAYFRSVGVPEPDILSPPAGRTAWSIEGIMLALTKRATEGKVYSEIGIVSHASTFGLSAPLREADDQGTMALSADLQNALAQRKAAAAGALAPASTAAVGAQSDIVIYGCEVGRDPTYLKLLAGVFGAPRSIAAPLRMAIFGEEAGKPTHRLARSWSIPWKGDIRKTTDWVTARKKFTEDASTKYEPDVVPGLGRGDYIAAASGAQADITKPIFFWNDIIPLHFRGRKSAARPELATGDDVSVSTTLIDGDFRDTDASNARICNLALLIKVLPDAVSSTNQAQYERQVFTATATPSTGPPPAGGGGGGGGAPQTGLIERAVDAVVAAGGSRQAIDDLLAAAAPAPAGEPDPADVEALAQAEADEPADDGPAALLELPVAPA